MNTAPTEAPPITADQLLGISAQLKQHGKRCELVAGELRIISPSGGDHGVLSARIGRVLDAYVAGHHLGLCFRAETGFVVQSDPDTVRAPDAAFVKQDRIDAIGISAKFFPESPTLAVEVVSPSESRAEVQAKAQMWIEAGSEMAWMISPEDRTLTDYRSLDNIRVLTSDQVLEGGDALPGFSLKVAELFVGLG